MKCKAYFGIESEGQRNKNTADSLVKFKEKSNGVPTKVEPALELFLRNLEGHILSMTENARSYSNLNRGEQFALKELKCCRDIVIKEADKGSAVVVWGIDDYLNEAQRQLGDRNIYELVEEDPIKKVSSEIDRKLVALMNQENISGLNRIYLRGKHHSLGRFYLLPKIHKRLENVPGRPVISNCGVATEKISEFVDFHLQPIVADLQHIIKDTNDFLRRLKDLGDIPEGAILCTMDVVGLYPHIPHDEGLDSVAKVIEEFLSRGRELVSKLDKQDLAGLAGDILENNYFEFNGNTYRQRMGTAIGTRFAPKKTFCEYFHVKIRKKDVK